MQPTLPPPGSAADWLRHARSDLALAAGPRQPAVLAEDHCFHAQQAVEKSLKAVLVHVGREPPHTHDIGYLLDCLVAHAPPAITEGVSLTRYAVQARYPGEVEPVTEDDLRRAVRVAQEALAWAETVIGGSGGNP